jgi:hypothetical protein
LSGLRAQAPELSGVTVFLVDDGSEPCVDPRRLPATNANFHIVLARHAVNLGQGAALETARQLALAAPAFSAYVTMDADGQHRTEDLGALVLAIDGGADVALGNRFQGTSNVPPMRRAILRGAQIFERLITGLSLSDAHNGYRAFSRRALGQVRLRENRMAHATELTLQIARAVRGNVDARRAGPLRVVEVPVSVRYTRESLARGQGPLGAFTILRDLFYRYLFEEPE